MESGESKDGGCNEGHEDDDMDDEPQLEVLQGGAEDQWSVSITHSNISQNVVSQLFFYFNK